MNDKFKGILDRAKKQDRINIEKLEEKESMKAIKHDEDKPRMELLPPEALEEISKVLGFGSKKYDAHNWRNGFKYSRLLGAALRHLVSYIGGEDKDPESGLSHLAHAGCCIMFLIAHERNGLGEDDRYNK